MRSTELTREQLERMQRDVERHHRYYLKLWRRAQANDMVLNDPFVQGICRAWDGVNQLAQLIERMKNRLAQHYRGRSRSRRRRAAWRNVTCHGRANIVGPRRKSKPHG